LYVRFDSSTIRWKQVLFRPYFLEVDDILHVFSLFIYESMGDPRMNDTEL
jgi:hypothetical protein